MSDISQIIENMKRVNEPGLYEGYNAKHTQVTQKTNTVNNLMFGYDKVLQEQQNLQDSKVTNKPKQTKHEVAPVVTLEENNYKMLGAIEVIKEMVSGDIINPKLVIDKIKLILANT